MDLDPVKSLAEVYGLGFSLVENSREWPGFPRTDRNDNIIHLFAEQ